MVANRRRDGRVEWTPPGGVVDRGEVSVEALSREVQEETGLNVEGWSEAVYRVTVDFPDRSMLLGVEVHLADGWQGDITIQDPDDIVEDARFVDPEEALRLLATAPPWVSEPVTAWLSASLPEPSGDGVPHFAYMARGASASGMRGASPSGPGWWSPPGMVVERLAPGPG